MKINGEVPWMKLDIPNYLQKVTRCDSSGKKSVHGKYWKVEKT